MLKPVGVTIVSKQYSYSEELYDLFFADRDGDDMPEEDGALLAALERPVTQNLDPKWLREEQEDEDVIEIFTEGRLHLSDGMIRLSYTEHDADSGEVKTVLSFSEKTPTLVTMSRSGAVNTTFVFEVGKRTKCVYNLMFAAMELTVFTIGIDNRLLTDGVITIEYCIEVRGSNVERRAVTTKIADRVPFNPPRE